MFDTFKEIKLRNEILKNSIYNQFWKQTSSSHRRPLSSSDSEKGKMHMELLEAQISKPNTATNYKKTSFKFSIEDIHRINCDGNE